jgi:carbohydrate kinase (thermoresistant glucokinase family)
VLRGYFPSQLAERFESELDTHPLRREIICTVVANEMINLGGITYRLPGVEETTATAAAVARAFVVVREAYALIFVIGVSGVGKTTVASALAAALGMRFIDADDLHPPGNKAKMGSGTPLTDEDRRPWLEAVGLAARQQPSVVACSALRRRYREYLLALAPDAVFVHLDAAHDDIARRIAARDHEYMPASLLESQLATLEPLEADEPGLRADATLPAQDLVRALVAQMADSEVGTPLA